MENSNRIDYDSLIEQISEFLSNYTQIRYRELVGAPWPYNHDGPLVYEEPEAILLDNSMEAIKELRKEIEKLNKEIADREQCSIDQHAEIHEYRDEIHEIEKKLTKVAIERDAAISDLYYACACEACELQYTDKCPLKKGMVPCSHIASALRNNTTYKWRGIQEVQEDE